MIEEPEKRLALDEAARLAPNNWSNVEICLLECGETSFRATCDVVLKLYSLVTLEVPGIGPARAYVVWRRGGEFVATFEEPIDLDQAKFMSVRQEAVLARLLGERARAQRAGRDEDERSLRERIRSGLPVRRAAG